MLADKAEKGAVTRAVRRNCTDVEYGANFGADYVAGGFIVERKRWAELPARMYNNENDLYMQLQRLVTAAEDLGKEPVLLIEGPMSEATRHSKVDTTALQKYLSGAFKMGVSTMTTLDEEHTSVVLESLDTPSVSPDVSAVRDPAKVPEGEMPRYVVEGLEGVGPKTARDLLKYFDTVENVMTATEDDLQQVGGVGPSTAKKIRSSATEEYGQ